MTNGSARGMALRKERQEEREAEARNGSGAAAVAGQGVRPVWSAYGPGE